MALNTVARGGKALITIPSGAALAVQSAGVVVLSTYTTYAQEPPQVAWLANSVAGQPYTTSTFSSGATIQIEAPYNFEVFYEVGTAPVVQFLQAFAGNMGGTAGAGAVQTMNVTATATVAQMLGQIITSTTAAAVTLTTPTATQLDAGTSLNIGDWFELVLINNGAVNAFAIAGGTGVTFVGQAGQLSLAAATSGRYRFVKTAAATYNFYRV